MSRQYELATAFMSYGRVSKSYYEMAIVDMPYGWDVKLDVWDSNTPYVKRTS